MYVELKIEVELLDQTVVTLALLPAFSSSRGGILP